MLQLLATNFCGKLFGRKRNKKEKLGLKVCQAGVRRFLPQRLHSQLTLSLSSTFSLSLSLSVSPRMCDTFAMLFVATAVPLPVLSYTAHCEPCLFSSLPPHLPRHPVYYYLRHFNVASTSLVFFSTFHFSMACKLCELFALSKLAI